MRTFVLAMFLVLAAGLQPTFATPSAPGIPGTLDCMSGSGSSPCSSGFNQDLYPNPTTLLSYNAVTVGGFAYPGDGGGGTFAYLANCSTSSVTVTNTTGFTQGSTTFSITAFPTGLAIGALIQSTSMTPNPYPFGAEVTAISSTTVTMSVPATSAAASGTITFVNNNGGTLVQDSSGHCYAKIDYRGDPHEWGGIGDPGTLSTDSTQAMEKWMASPGPWSAAIPATYVINNPLICWPGINIRGIANQTVKGSTQNSSPLITISAGPSFSQNTTLVGPGIINARPGCRISGLAIDAGATGQFYLPVSGTITGCTAPGCTVTITSGSVSGVQLGYPISATHIQADSYVTGIAGSVITVS